MWARRFRETRRARRPAAPKRKQGGQASAAGMMAALLCALAVAGCASPGQHRYREAEPTGPEGALRLREAEDAPRAERAALLDEAVALALEGRYEEARSRFAVLAERAEAAGDAEHASESLFWQGYCLEKGGRPEEARPLYERVLRDHPGTPAARQAGQRLELLGSPPIP